jgi:hypothetical protein
MRLILGLIGWAGAALFGAALALTYLSPIHVERAARGFIENRIERELAEQFADVRHSDQSARAGRLAAALANRHEAEAAALRKQLASGLNAQITAAVARMQDLSCECREQLHRGSDAGLVLRIARLERAEPQLRLIIEGKYSDIIEDLLRDLRIFAGTNLAAFLMLLALSALKPSHLRQLFVPGILLGTAAVATSAIYLFGQNWFLTLLYADYVGWTYGIWLVLIFGLFSDIVLLKARFTTKIVNALSLVLGKAPIPC